MSVVHALTRSLVLLAVFSAASVASAQLYATVSGTKYHLYRNCSSLKQAKKVVVITLSQARKRKITMCDLCQATKKKESQPKKRGG